MGEAYSTSSLLNRPDLVGVWNWDMQSNRVIACGRVCEYVNAPIESGLQGIELEKFLEGIHPNDRAGLSRSVQIAMEEDAPLAVEYRVVSQKHGTRWVSSNGRCFYASDGTPLYFSGFLTDLPTADPLPSDHADLVKHLIAARQISASLDDTMLQKLIEAVLLEVSLKLAARLRKSD